MSLLTSNSEVAPVPISSDSDQHTLPNVKHAAVADPPRLKVSFSLDGVSAPVQKTFLVNYGQEGMLETLLRRAFSIPANCGVSLVLDQDTIYYPVHVIDLTEARKAKSIELQTFPIQPMPMQLPLNVPMPYFANNIPNNIPQLIPQVEYVDQPYANQSKDISRPMNDKTSAESLDVENNINQQSTATATKRKTTASTKKTTSNVKKNALEVVDSNLFSNNTNNSDNNASTTGTHHVISSEHDHDSEHPQDTAIAANNRKDRRKNNRGLDHRRSYLKEEKILVMWLKDCGKSADDIAAMTHVSKSNVEKWCSDKTREKILLKFRSINNNNSHNISNNSNNKDLNDVLGDTLDEPGLHFARDNRVSMQSSLLFLLDRLKTLSSESNMAIDETALFTAAGLSVPATNNSHNAGNNDTITTNNVDNSSINSGSLSVGNKRVFNLDTMCNLNNNNNSSYNNSNQAMPDFLMQSKRARLNVPGVYPPVSYPYLSVYPPNALHTSTLANVTRGFVPPHILQPNNTSFNIINNLSNSNNMSDDEEDEVKAHMMLEEMLRSRRQSLGLIASAKPNSNNTHNNNTTINISSNNNHNDININSYVQNSNANNMNNTSDNGENKVPQKRVKSSLDLLSDLTEAETASIGITSDTNVKHILASNLRMIPANSARYEDIRMEYNDQFACTIPTTNTFNNTSSNADDKSTHKEVNELDSDTKSVETSGNNTAVSITNVPALAVSTSGSVQALRSVLPNTKYLLQIRPQLREKQSDQDKEDEMVMAMLGE